VELVGVLLESPLRPLDGLDAVDQEVALGAGAAAIYRVGAGLLSPFFAGTLAEYNDARDQSMRPSLPSLSSFRGQEGLDDPPQLVADQRSFHRFTLPSPDADANPRRSRSAGG
jgi:hypothetical protein